MSHARAMAAISMQPTDMPAQWENIQHPAWIDSKRKEGESFASCALRLIEEYELDIVSLIPGPEMQFGNVPVPLTVGDADEIYGFDPFHPPRAERIDYVEALGVHPSASIDEMADSFSRKWRKNQDHLGQRALSPGAQWHQLVHYFSTTFGWEMTALAAYSNRPLFREVLSKFASLTKKVLTAWSQTGVQLMICHDDLAMVDRTIFPPQWYREEIFPTYREIWSPLQEAGIPFIFMSDGKIDPIIGDIAKIGVTGFYLDDMVDFPRVADELGKTHVLVGNTSVTKLSFSDTDVIDKDIESCVMTGKRCTSHVIQCSGGIMESVPLSRVDHYFRRVLELRRGVR